MKKFLILIVFVFLNLTTLSAYAAFSPLAAAILAPVQFPANDFAISGLRASVIWGQHRNIYGFDFGGIGNITEQDFGGIGVSGIFNATRGNTVILGLQAAGVTNYNTGKVRLVGFQLAGGLNINKAESTALGFQIAPLGNVSPFTKVYGMQVGLYNSANEVYGFQIGLINSAELLHGIQIGLVNFNKKGLFSTAPILNVGF